MFAAFRSRDRGVGLKAGTERLTASLPVVPPREAQLRSGRLLPAVRWGWSAAARKRPNQKYCSFKFDLDVKLQLNSPKTNTYYLLVDQLTFSAELLKWFFQTASLHVCTDCSL